MVMCDYFSAASDEAAVGVLDGPGGPDPSVFDVLSLKGVDPVVVMARLEGILTDCTYDEARARPRSGQLLSDPEARFIDLGPGFYDSRISSSRKMRNHVSQLEALGYKVTLQPAA